jgi:hypothetical protein
MHGASPEKIRLFSPPGWPRGSLFPLAVCVSGVHGYAAMCVVQATLYLFTPTYRELLLLLLSEQ